MSVARDQDVVSLKDTDIFYYPLLYLNGHGNILLSSREVENLRRYLDSGGFLWADDNYGLDASFRRELSKVYPNKKLVDVPLDHPIYRGFYEFEKGPPKIHEHNGQPPRGLGIFDEGRLTVFYTYESDVGDGLEDPRVHGDSAGIREKAMRMAIQIVNYVLSH